MVFGTCGTNRPILHIIIIMIIIIIIIHIFLFHTASANLIVYFPLKPMGVCFVHCWPASPHFKFRFITHLQITATSFVVLAHVDDREAIQMHTKQPVKEGLLHY